MRRVFVLLAVLLMAAGLSAATAPAASAQPSDIQRVAIIGDSFTTGYGVAAGQGYADLLEADDPLADNVLPLAVNGATVRRWNTEHRTLLDQIDTWQPTTVVIALGGNDWSIGRKVGDFQNDLTYLIWTVRSKVPTARVILWHYYPLGIPVNTSVCDVWPCQSQATTWGAYANAMRDAAILNGTGYIDNSVHSPAWSTYYLPDRTHLTAAGHQQEYADIRARLVACC
jgi:lysophospholipase L1-like esterase